jgi:hypothetical protein
MSKLRDALNDGKEDPESLQLKLGIKHKRHPTYPDLVQFKYDQINSPMSHPLVQEARGIILDSSDYWRPVARPFNKFFNMGEPLAAELDWTTARVVEKLDGSLCILYWHDDMWNVATSGSPDAGGNVGKSTMSFANLFWQIWHDSKYTFDPLKKTHTYMFELCAPENKVVVQHQDRKLVLIGCRETASGQEIQCGYEDWFSVARTFPLTNKEDVVSSFSSFDGLQQEGYVVVDECFRRLKIKHPRYVFFHQMLGSLTDKKLLDSVRSGETTELLTYFPEWSKRAGELSEQYERLLTRCQDEYETIKSLASQKEFAAEALKTVCRSAMFTVRSGKVSGFREYFRELPIDRVWSLTTGVTYMGGL